MNSPYLNYDSPRLRTFRVKRVFQREEKHISIRLGVLFKNENVTIYRNFYTGQDHPKHIQAFISKLETDEEYTQEVISQCAPWQWVDQWYNNLVISMRVAHTNPQHPHNQIDLEQAYKVLKNRALKKANPARVTDLVNLQTQLSQGKVDLGVATLCDFLLHSGVTVKEPTQGHGTHVNQRPQGPASITLDPKQNQKIQLLPAYVLSHRTGDHLTFTEKELVDLNKKLINDYPERVTLAAAKAAEEYPLSLELNTDANGRNR